MSLIICKNLSAGYDGRAVVSGVDFNVEAGDRLCIIGENGSGKSTLVKTILGLQKPVSGEIIFGDGVKPTEIGYVSQASAAQNDFPATVKEVVLSGCLNGSGWRPFYTREQKATAEKNMKLFELDNLANRCFRELSGGQRQRVLLARALCAAKRLLLLDEPVTGLDPLVTEELYELTDKLNADYGLTIISVTHDVNAVVKHCSEVLFVAKKCFFGGRDEFLQSRLAENFLAGEAKYDV